MSTEHAVFLDANNHLLLDVDERSDRLYICVAHKEELLEFCALSAEELNKIGLRLQQIASYYMDQDKIPQHVLATYIGNDLIIRK